MGDVQAIDEKYNSNYLRAEYNFVQNSAQMATKWELYEQDGDRYNLQYRTAGDNRVRPEHQALDGITLPITDPFWDSYYPPNGWNCRCTVAQVRKSKYPVTPRDEAMQRGQEALTKDKKGIFKFNPGKQKKAVPDYNPYTISQCNTCSVTKGKLSLSKPLNCDLCQVCQNLRQMVLDEKKKRLKYVEIQNAKKMALKWADIHLKSITLPNGQIAKRTEIINDETKATITINKDSIGEIFTKNKNNRYIAETLLSLTQIKNWLPDADFLRLEKGIHHKNDFMVLSYSLKNGDRIECKVMKKKNKRLLLYNMRLYKKKEN